MICPFLIKLRFACIKGTTLTLTGKNDITITEYQLWIWEIRVWIH